MAERNFIVRAVDKLSDMGRNSVVRSSSAGKRANIPKRVGRASGKTAHFIKGVF